MNHATYLGHHEKTKPMNHGCRRRRGEKTKGNDNLLNKKIAENFPNLKKKRVTQVQEAYRTPNCQDQKRNTPRCIITKAINTQNKERILKAAKEIRQVTYKGKPLRIMADF
jgi:hypothetical protein